MKSEIIQRRLLTFWPLNTAGWGAYFLINCLRIYLVREDMPSDFNRLIIVTLVGFALSSLLRLLYTKLVFTFRAPVLVTFVLLASLVTAFVWFFISLFFHLQVIEGQSLFPLLAHARIGSLAVDLFFKIVIITSWSACYYVLKLWIEWDHQTEQARLASLKAHKAQLQMLQYRLNPQLIFSSLNTIRSLVGTDKQEAKSMVTQLSEFLRYSIVSSNTKMVPLSEEIDALHNYLKIEKRRYESNLAVDIDVESPAGDFPVQNFLLQPLVENAIRVGMLTSPQPLKLTIHASASNSTLSIRISSTGKWKDTKEVARFGDSDESVRLEDVRLRLISLHPNLQTFDVEELEDVVNVNIKLNRELN